MDWLYSEEEFSYFYLHKIPSFLCESTDEMHRNGGRYGKKYCRIDWA